MEGLAGRLVQWVTAGDARRRRVLALAFLFSALGAALLGLRRRLLAALVAAASAAAASDPRSAWMTASDDDSDSEPRFDYVVVGGGTAGCVLANRLSAHRHHGDQRSGVSVLLVESGGEMRPLSHWRLCRRFASIARGRTATGGGTGSSGSGEDCDQYYGGGGELLPPPSRSREVELTLVRAGGGGHPQGGTYPAYAAESSSCCRERREGLGEVPYMAPVLQRGREEGEVLEEERDGASVGLAAGCSRCWRYPTEPQRNAHYRRLELKRARTLGGSSAIDLMLYVRGSPTDYNAWVRSFGCAGWSYAEVLPLFLKSEKWLVSAARSGAIQSPGSSYHSTDGELPVSSVDHCTPIARAFVESAESLGIPFNDDYNAATQEGVAYPQYTIANGKRVTAYAAFLPPEVRKRPNLTICTYAHVTNIVFDDKNRAIGVEFRTQSDNHQRLYRVMARTEVIIAAGALETPKLLMLSGLGPREHLRRKRIPLMRDIPAVGHSLQDPIVCTLGWLVQEPITFDASVAVTLHNIFSYSFFKTGPFASPGIEAVIYTRTQSCGLPRPLCDVALILSTSLSLMPSDIASGPLDSSHYGLTISVALLHPQSRGRVLLRSRNPFDTPIVQPNYLEREEDVETLVEGLALARTLVSHAAFAQFHPTEIIAKDVEHEHPQVSSSNYLRAYGRRYLASAGWTVGTCRMGRSLHATESGSVVGPRLKVHGIDGLRIVDASVIPEVPSGGKRAAVVMIAEKASEMILADRQRATKHAASEPAAEPAMHQQQDASRSSL